MKKEGMIMSRSVAIDQKIQAHILADANRSLDHEFQRFVEERRARQSKQVEHQVAMTDALHRLLAKDNAAAAEASRHLNDPDALKDLISKFGGRSERGWPARASHASGKVVADYAQSQLLGPPFIEPWTPPSDKSGNAEVYGLWASVNGEFGFTQSAAGGSVTSAAGLWVQFRPDPPLPRQIQVLPDVLYYAQWWDNSVNGWTAHNDANFGVYVLSWNDEGADKRLEQDQRFPAWSDNTGWWSNDFNPNWPGWDFGVGIPLPPYFQADPNRIYMACMWCYGSCDASGGGEFSNALSGTNLQAKAYVVVINEQ
jgi:hypothetical protein